MFLRRVTITGFKSFANKTVIELEHGITGVVGPNGSGKSNIADAIRWALGEQRGSRLRLEGRDEVVFAGSDKRPRASFAEVILVFNNEDGAFAYDFTEVEISRRLYRSGETDYQLGGRSVRLSDIQALLAKAGVGAGTYAVIGQGMIDSILMSSPAERKLLFEDAAGTRSAEIGREAAIRKLTATANNLVRLRDISAELAPRVGALKYTENAAQEREELEAKVMQLRTDMVRAEQSHFQAEVEECTLSLDQLKARAHHQRHSYTALLYHWKRYQIIQVRAEVYRDTMQQELADLELRRDGAAAEVAAVQIDIAAVNREVSIACEHRLRLEAINAEIIVAEASLADMHAQLSSNTDAGSRALKAVEKLSREVATAQSALVAVREGTGDIARDQYVNHALQILKTLAIGLGTPDCTDNQIRLLVHKAGRLLSHAGRSGTAELVAELKSAQKQLEGAMTKRDIAVEHQTNVSITGRSLEIDLGHQEVEIFRINSRRDELAQTLEHSAGSAARLAKLAVAEHAAARSLEVATISLDGERATLANLPIGAHAIEVGSRLLSELEKVTSTRIDITKIQAQVSVKQTEAKFNFDTAVHRAAKWKLSSTALISGPQLPLAVLSDQLARAETLLEVKQQMFESQITEYEQVTLRQIDLSSQISDLEAAEVDLRTLVTELDARIRSRFKENFQALAEQFGIYFERLFPGGNASLELSETEGAGYGITIKASPAGKRLTSIAALSGGERAMAGVALVAAIMQVNPSPFVVLDEIDAALDEANSGRLADILVELQQHSQLIVITHNRQTMRAAKVLFGVTMNEHHISHLISMRLERATELAAR